MRTIAYTNNLAIKIAEKGKAPEATQIFLGYGAKNGKLGELGKETGEISFRQSGENLNILVSLGTKEDAPPYVFRQAGAELSRRLSTYDTPITACLVLSSCPTMQTPETRSAFFEGLYLGTYSYRKRKSATDKPGEITIIVHPDEGSDGIANEIDHARLVTEAVNFGKEWVHEPANVINPVSMAEQAQALASETDLKCTVLDDKALGKLNAGGILSVGQGSRTPPRLIILEYPGNNPPSGAKPVVIVGKAITFDSGGYSLKGSANIQNMKFDKSGGVTVAAVMKAVAELKIQNPVVGIIPAAENMVSENSYRPDDIITTLSGKTIEIISTDAEGRLVLADALTYAQKYYNPDAIIDVATLTGGVVVALGRIRAGLMSNNDGLAKALTTAGEATHERLWQLPLDEDFFLPIRGDEADLKNSGGREGQTISGGIFLKQFVSDDIPWAHIDIAGTAYLEKATPLNAKGATGFGIRLLIHYLETLK